MMGFDGVLAMQVINQAPRWLEKVTNLAAAGEGFFLEEHFALVEEILIIAHEPRPSDNQIERFKENVDTLLSYTTTWRAYDLSIYTVNFYDHALLCHAVEQLETDKSIHK